MMQREERELGQAKERRAILIRARHIIVVPDHVRRAVDDPALVPMMMERKAHADPEDAKREPEKQDPDEQRCPNSPTHRHTPRDSLIMNGSPTTAKNPTAMAE